MDINKVVIGDPDAPLLVFENKSIESITEDTAVAIVGDELSVDQFTPSVRYHVFLRYVFSPADYAQFITRNGLIMCCHYSYDIRKLPYATPVTFYSNGKIRGKYYSETVDRLGRDQYGLNAISAIGLMDKQRSVGGIYSGQLFPAVLKDILGSDYQYAISDDVAAVPVYGWLPFSTRRQNLHQLIMAYGVNIIRSDTGDMLFTFLRDSEAEDIPESEVFYGGSMRYNDPASRVEVTEHAYHYIPTVETKTLFDNSTTDAVHAATVTFDEPIMTDTLETTGGLKIHSAGVNYAVISGVGVLTGKPYTHTTKIVSADNPDAVNENVRRVEDATLVSLQNSENVLARLSQYYFNVDIVENDIVLTGERCGKRYNVLNGFYEETTGFISKMSASISSIIRARCEFIQNYTPVGTGATYTNCVILPEDAGSWEIPESVFQKEIPKIRVVLIGNGHRGEDGEAGETGKPGDGNRGGDGGKGGAGGNAGVGGKIYSETYKPSGDATTLFYGRDLKGNSYIKGGMLNITSADGVSTPTGFLEVFSGKVFALPGTDGLSGADGGKGGYLNSNGSGKDGENGGDFVADGQIWYGGIFEGNFEDVVIDSQNPCWIGNGGGGGAAYGSNGANSEWLGRGGKGGDGHDAFPAAALYGNGGNGGNGGGGGGGGGTFVIKHKDYGNEVGRGGYAGGDGGAPGAGSPGYQGCVIIYY